MIIGPDSITLAFLVVSAVTFTAVAVLSYMTFSSVRFKQDIINRIEEKLDNYLEAQATEKNIEDNIKEQEQEREELKAAVEPTNNIGMKTEEPMSFVEKPSTFTEKPNE